MARKRSSFQPQLFSTDPDEPPAPDDDPLTRNQGGPDAVQDDRASPPGADSGDVRPAPREPDAAADPGAAGGRAEGLPRGVEAAARPDQLGHQRGAGVECGDGDGAEGSGGRF